MRLADIFSAAPFDSACSTSQEQFFDALKWELIFHYENNEHFFRFCKKKQFDPYQFQDDLNSVPFIPVQVFKALGHDLNSVEQGQIVHKLHSSATSGRPSTILVDKVTAKRQAKIMAKVMADFIGPSKLPMIVIDLDVRKFGSAHLGARSAAIKGYINFGSKIEFVVNQNKHGLFLDGPKLEDIVSKLPPDEPVLVFGFTYIIYDFLVRNEEIRVKLPANSKIIHIGGWKKLESEKISKDLFNNRLASKLGIDSIDVIDVYGFTEQLGLNYPDCKAGWKHAPTYSRVLVRDSKGQLKEIGEVGRLQFVSPLTHSYPGNSVITDDLGYIDPNPAETCVCGRNGTRFRVSGRVKKAEIRGCGDVMSEFISSSKSRGQSHEGNIPVAGLEVLFNTNSLDGIAKSDGELILEIERNLRSQQEWLARQPVEALIGLIDKVSRTWMKDSFELTDLRERGLGFLVQWCSAENLQTLVDNSVPQGRQMLDAFCVVPGNLNRRVKAVPRGVAAHWLSGNVPLLGMLVVVIAILTKNLNLIKVAASYKDALPVLLSSFAGVSYTTPGGHTLTGDELLKTLAVVYYDHSNSDCAATLSKLADIRVAWGGTEAIHHVLSLPKKWSVRDVMFGPKLSFSVIAKEAINSPRKLRKILRRVATDSSAFDQTACASPHTIFVEHNDLTSAKEFAALLAPEMEKATQRIPVTEKSQENLDEIATVRAVYDFIGDVWQPKEADWTVLYDDEVKLASPTYSRVITVRSVADIMQCLDLIDETIQSIGLAAEGSKRLNFSESAVLKGVDRCPDVGFMTNFEVPWDGIDIFDQFVRKATLGGPT